MPVELWQDLSTRDFVGIDVEATVALLPLAAVEAHGAHLPLGTDAVINHGVVEAALARPLGEARVLRLPPLDVGDSLEHTAFAGTLSAGAETLLALWLDVAAGVARAGVRKLVLFNSHGGQTALAKLAALRMRDRHGLLVARADYFAFGVPPGLFEADELAHGIHGGEVETSLMLHLRPDLVRREHLADFEGLPRRMARRGALLGPERPVGFGWMSQDLHPDGVSGNAARADAQRGAALLDHLADRLAQLLAEMAAIPLTILRDTREPRG
ncbi:MAG: creatininase family protein [Pseudomonadota bacterium]